MEKVKRKVNFSRADERKPRKIRLTDDEYDNLLACTERFGYDRPRDWIADTVSGKNPYRDTENAIRSKLWIELSPIANLLNMIHADVDAEKNTQQLIKECDELCRAYRL